MSDIVNNTQFGNFSMLGKWFEDNTEEILSYKEISELVIWFVASQRAEEMSGYTARDMTDVMVSGLKPITIESVNEWLQEQKTWYVDDCGESIEDFDSIMVKLLKRHRGV